MSRKNCFASLSQDYFLTISMSYAHQKENTEVIGSSKYCTRDVECDFGECGRPYHHYCHVSHNTCGCMHAPPHDDIHCTSDRNCINMHCPEHEHYHVTHVCHAGKCHCMKDIKIPACGPHVRRRHPHPSEEECPAAMCSHSYSTACLSSKCACTRQPPACHSDHDCGSSHCSSHQTPQCFDSSCYCVDTTTTTRTTTTTTTTTQRTTTTVVGLFSEWQPWGQCSATCEGIRLRFRSCKIDGSCNGSTTEIHQCGVNHCPVNGILTAWGSWTPCSATCGGGTQMRSRTCIPPQHGGKDCAGSLFEVNNHCNSDACPVIGHFNEWQAWGQCTATCGGMKVRTRTCQVAGSCHGDTQQVHQCGAQICPVDGTLTAWGSWTPCSVSCGGGSQVRTRACIPPQHGGKNCAGSLFEVNSHCNPDACTTTATTTTTTPTTATTTTTTTPTTTTTTTTPTTTTSLTTTTSSTTTDANAGAQCPYCDNSKTCKWNRTCPDSETCMIRSPQGSNFTLHCSAKQDCLLIKSVLPADEIHCCDDRGCVEEHLGLRPKAVECPQCDEVLNCSWNRTCPDSQTCMIRSYHGFKFTVHCSVADDCTFIQAALPSGEIYCCNDRKCLSTYLGI